MKVYEIVMKGGGGGSKLAAKRGREIDGPFEIVECIGPVANRLKLPQEMSCIRDTCHVSNLKKCLAESDVHVPLEDIKIDETLHFVEQPIETVERDNNPERDRYPFDLSKLLHLQGHLERTYTMSIMKSKVAWYEIEGVVDMKILGVKSVSVKKLHGYGDMKEIVVKRADRLFYKFKEGDFVELYLNDIEDMLFLDVQHKLFHLTNNDIVHFIVALSMFTRSLIIKKRVEDLQLGVESY
nr:putative reverse transcriptase domain-containing protein [Tanacetum cinerariifolium]